MIILITYEKADILRLILADMQARGLTVKGETLAYKGALQCKFEVDVKDEEPTLTPAPARAPVRTEAPEAAEAPDTPEDLGALMKQSQHLQKIKPAPFDRPLGVNEFEDFETAKRQ